MRALQQGSQGKGYDRPSSNSRILNPSASSPIAVMITIASVMNRTVLRQRFISEAFASQPA